MSFKPSLWPTKLVHEQPSKFDTAENEPSARDKQVDLDASGSSVNRENICALVTPEAEPEGVIPSGSRLLAGETETNKASCPKRDAWTIPE